MNGKLIYQIETMEMDALFVIETDVNHQKTFNEFISQSRSKPMCGIIGYLGPQNPVEVIFEGLRKLEYRGYDSAGIAVIRDNHFDVRRSQGKLNELGRLLSRSPIAGKIGIGHTRWATHG
jgi:glutamate synthase domain-containing protein 1